ncbi:copper resistance system multicopper oxidase [Halomonas saccharevitans]|uniref:Copper-resistance protein, CopA family n=1 Tax=Halomonas saccharevitans TaxID=416872 RepID=A0A1I6X9P7_9GAMM|nr:copper resistance system multicopper oxidase [Halomonas saccharevitans]SFT35000.1 copper-resistance protein, CopA family [Halomonas saccharevitans]
MPGSGVIHHPLTRRQILKGGAALGLGSAAALGVRPGWADPWGRTSVYAKGAEEGPEVALAIRREALPIDGQSARPMTINGTSPGPLIRLKEGQEAVLKVTNLLDEPTSIHWHGLILPPGMDGVPGVSFAGIAPGETFTYRFPVRQNGTYWYHSHSGLQEQLGHAGPLIIDAAEREPFRYDREHVLLLTDWTFEDPMSVFRNLKTAEGYYNAKERTVADFFADVREKGFAATAEMRSMWAKMRMSSRDIADVTGSTYSYLLNGHAPQENWTALFKRGERVRLRVINGSAMSYFDVRIPGLKMTVVAADGQPVQPVPVDEFRIAVAETYDVLVAPEDDTAYTIFAESMDRSGYARATLAPREGMSAELPERRAIADRGMEAMGAHGMAGMDHGTMAGMAGERSRMSANGMLAAGTAQPGSRFGQAGIGITPGERRTLVYGDLKAFTPWPDRRAPARELELHLTGNMERYIWSFDGKTFSEMTGPLHFHHGERLRLILINDTMMEHPIHLHGMWMELENGHGELIPRKHTLNVKPGERVSALITADAEGSWAFHCHLLYHMKAGMFRVVQVS